MSRQVLFTFTAERRLTELLHYLADHWSEKAKEKFLARLDQRLKVIIRDPECFPQSTLRSGLHKCVVTRRSTFYYTFDADNIYVLTFFDSRQDPERLTKEIG